MEARRVVKGVVKFEGVRAAERCGCYLRYAVLVSAGASRLLHYLVRGFGPGFI